MTMGRQVLVSIDEELIPALMVLLSEKRNELAKIDRTSIHALGGDIEGVASMLPVISLELAR